MNSFTKDDIEKLSIMELTELLSQSQRTSDEDYERLRCSFSDEVVDWLKVSAEKFRKEAFEIRQDKLNKLFVKP